MTTIACDGKTISGDSQSTNGHSASSTKKLFKFTDFAVGFAGDESAGQKFVEWIEHRRGDPPDISEFEALVFYKDGRMEYWDDNMHPITIKARYYAIGSGAYWAEGCMFHGLSTEQALRASKEHDVYTGGKIITYKFTRNTRGK